MNDFNMSEQQKALLAALLHAQAAVRPIVKDSANTVTHSRYASLSAVLEAVSEPLRDNGLLVIQLPVASPPGTTAIETRIVHVESGESIVSTTVIPLQSGDSKTTPAQQVGSALTYARRYALMTMLNLSAVEDDDDGNGYRRNERQGQQNPQKDPSDSRPEQRLPELEGVTWHESVDRQSGRRLLFASGKTLINRERLQELGFRWSPERRTWWREASGQQAGSG